jgi:hypothetical protein
MAMKQTSATIEVNTTARWQELRKKDVSENRIPNMSRLVERYQELFLIQNVIKKTVFNDHFSNQVGQWHPNE